MDTNTDTSLCCPVCLLEMENASTELEVRRLCLGPTWRSASVSGWSSSVGQFKERPPSPVCPGCVAVLSSKHQGHGTVLEGCSREVKQRIVCTLYCGIAKG